MSAIAKMVEREVAGQIAGALSLERRRNELECSNLRRRIDELERQGIRNAERIRALERVNEHGNNYLPPEAAQWAEGLLERLRGIGVPPAGR